MRRFPTRQQITTVMLAAILMPYLGLLLFEQVPFVHRPRGMAGIGLVGLLLALDLWSPRLDSRHGRWVMLGGVIAAGIGIAAVAIGAEGSASLLALFMGTLVGLWTLEASVGDAGLERPAATHRRPVDRGGR